MQTSLAYGIVSKLLRQNETVLQENLNFIYYGTKIPSCTAKLTLAYLVFSFKESFLNKDSYLIENTLSPKDISRLVNANYPLCHELTETLRIKDCPLINMENEVEAMVQSVMKELDDSDKDKVSRLYSKVSI